MQQVKFLKLLLFCSELLELHRSLKVFEPEREKGRVSKINQEFLWDVLALTQNRLQAQSRHRIKQQGGLSRRKGGKELCFITWNAPSFSLKIRVLDAVQEINSAPVREAGGMGGVKEHGKWEQNQMKTFCPHEESDGFHCGKEAFVTYFLGVVDILLCLSQSL